MTYLTNLDPFPIKSLSKGDVVYYADAHAIETDAIHLLQVTTVAAITSTSVLFDNGRKFLLSGEEVTRGSKGAIYAYTSLTKAMVTEAQNKLALLNDVKAINFNSLSLQQLSMILDVARGAFTQITAPAPCGGCGNTVKVAGIEVELEQKPTVTYYDDSTIEVSSPIAFTDASYELTESELDDIEDADDNDGWDEDPIEEDPNYDPDKE